MQLITNLGKQILVGVNFHKFPNFLLDLYNC
jgi:hypothetical protein